MNAFAEHHYSKYLEYAEKADRAERAGFYNEANRFWEMSVNEYDLWSEYVLNPPRNMNEDY